MAKQRVGGDSPAAHRLTISQQEMFDETRESREKAARRMKKYADQHRWALEFQIEDKVLLKLTPQILKKVSSKTRQRGLIPKFKGPFKVIKKVGESRLYAEVARKTEVASDIPCQFFEALS